MFGFKENKQQNPIRFLNLPLLNMHISNFPEPFPNVLASFSYNLKSVLFDIHHYWQKNEFIFFGARCTGWFST